MRIAFLGTPPFAATVLDALAGAGHDIVCVVAQPDRPAGRGQALKEPATKVWAMEHGFPVLQPEKVRDGKLAAELQSLHPDVLVVAAYGRILGKDLLELAPLGALNVHGSLLPKYRGAAPIQWAIAEGETETGVTIMQMDAGLDTGDVLLQRVLPILPGETSGALHDRLAVLGGQALVEALPLLARGSIVPVPQESGLATLAPVLEKGHGRLDFAMPAAKLANRVRAFTPWPGAFTTLGGKTLKIHRVEVSASPPVSRAPGQTFLTGDGWAVACGDGKALLLSEVQLEGRKRLTAAEFLRGISDPELALGT